MINKKDNCGRCYFILSNGYCEKLRMIVDKNDGWCSKYKFNEALKYIETVTSEDIYDIHHMVEKPIESRSPNNAYICPDCNHIDGENAWNHATKQYFGNPITLISDADYGCDYKCPSCGEIIVYDDIEVVQI